MPLVVYLPNQKGDTMEQVVHAIGWFEIPVADFDRARSFYSRIFDYEMPEMPAETVRMGILPCDMEKGGIGGAIIAGNDYIPGGSKGCMVYLNGGKNLQVVMDRIIPAGGKIIQVKTEIPGMGFYSFFSDSEGNKVGLYSMG